MNLKQLTILFSWSCIFSFVHSFNVHKQSCSFCPTKLSLNASRRDLFQATGASVAALIASTGVSPVNAIESNEKVLVLGGTGFVGSEICKKLQSMGIDYIASSRDGRDGTIAIDFSTDENISDKIAEISKGYTAVISTVGAIGTESDLSVNKGSGLAAIGAKTSGVKRFVYISVAPEVRESASGFSFLTDYMDGKKFSEDTIKNCNFDSYTIIAPTFIYGGDKFAINPPRVAEGYGSLVESVLSSGPFRYAASISPGIIGVALEPPVNVATVADAAIAASLGLSDSVLDTYDEIKSTSKLI
jgi:uncharacterized protein YbjT (DUF2867 family)